LQNYKSYITTVMNKLKINKLTLFSTIFILIFSSCSQYQKLLKSNDYNLKFEKAVEYYQKKDFDRALSLFEDLTTVFRGTQRAEEVDYYYAYCTYYTGDILMAAYYFDKFYKTYPLSKHTEECEFMAAYCLYEYSPSPDLDQTYTHKAINHFQLFLTHYPQTQLKDSVNHLITHLNHKLETKAFNNAKLYLMLGHYKAAIVALKNVLQDYPNTSYREDILFNILKSGILLAKNSIEKKKYQRYNNTIGYYYDLIDQFPNTKYKKEAQKIYKEASKYIENSDKPQKT